MRSVNHRFQNLIIRIVHGRLLLAASLQDRKLILECYHPSAQYTEPYLFCDYLGTPGLSDTVAGQGSIYEAHTGDGLLRSLYSHFRPTRRRLDSKTPRSHPAGDIPGSRTSAIAASRSARQDDADDKVIRIVNLDANENFSQLVFSIDLVQLGPHKVLFTDIVKVNAKTTLRIFRQWAAHQAAETRRSQTLDTRESGTSLLQEDGNSVLTWIDDKKKKAGLRFRVEERKWRKEAPLLLRRDEDHAISYSMELQSKQIVSKAGIDQLFIASSEY